MLSCPLGKMKYKIKNKNFNSTEYTRVQHMNVCTAVPSSTWYMYMYLEPRVPR